MKHIFTVAILGMVFALLVSLNYCDCNMKEKVFMYKNAGDIKKVISLFDISAQEIATNTKKWIADAQKSVEHIIAIPDENRMYENTMQALDHLVSLSDMIIGMNLFEGLELLSPIDDIRHAAHEASLQIQAFYVEAIGNNKALYKAIKSYADLHAKNENLTDEQQYFVKETIEDFERAGLGLPDEQLAQIKELNKKIQKLSAEFEKNIASDNRTVAVTQNELTGLTDEFITNLSKDEDGNYILGIDYPTYFYVMQNCTNSETRKKLWQAFNNRAYPVNDSILKELLALRDQKAKLLGYNSFAQLNLADQMVKTDVRADKFLHNLIAKIDEKVNQEFTLITTDLPEGISLTNKGKLRLWDSAFTINYYKKNTLQINEEEIKEYFPMEHTIDQLLAIYQQFLNVHFEQVPVSGLWHEEVKALQVYDKEKTELLGTLFLDLHPRDNKYSHACHTTIIPTVTLSDETIVPDVSIVIANFPKSTQKKPSLLRRDDVSTFFHEFGHAMHAILGRTRVASFSGTSTKTDFVELPSQMLEEWLWDTEILKMVSKHYKTGESLPDELIEKIQKNKTLLTGNWMQQQSFLSLLCLAYYADGEDKDMFGIMKKLFEQYRPHMQFDDNNHFYASYGHLPSYAARYYGYLWSKVFALDVFAQIKPHGLLNGEIGAKYVDAILSRGGSKDPNELLVEFLGREPNSKAFFEDMGL